MNKVYACIDGLRTTTAVIDWAAWAADCLDVPLELLHVLEREPEGYAVADFSGAIGLGAQETLLQQLSDLDAKKAKLAQVAGRQVLDRAQERVRAGGLERVQVLMRHGELTDTVIELEPDARLFVLGEHHRAEDAKKLHLDHHLERVIRAVKRPVLVATAEQFFPPERFVIAFDGSDTAIRIVQTVARSPMLKGLSALIVMCGSPLADAQAALRLAQTLLEEAGFEVSAKVLPGEPEHELPVLLDGQGAALLVMGAYGHSRIRHLVLGSTTTTLLRLSRVPVLVLR
ncbi:universal stress protein UspA [Acidovorax temperans]|uniref:Universal stress protein UspA n=1 Tax=Acidovorax temperans TaxID=80878 RepID=A0A0D7K9W8_9BURK|nr:universal stress protein [Acidovorax temperans]KJA11110.1 universal stress protein UspA [Acidovorax temperans]